MSGTGFAGSSTITITYDGTAQTTSPATITTSPTGAFSATFTVPSSAIGSHTVQATDGTNSPTATFTVTPVFTQPTITTKSVVAASTSLQYSVTQANSFVVIVVTSGDYQLTSAPTWPSGFTQQEGISYSNQYSDYIAVNTAQAINTYTVSCQAPSSSTGISIAVYVFAPGTYSYVHNSLSSSGSSTSETLTLTAGANYYIFGGSIGSGTISLSTTTIDVKDSSNWSAIGHQTTNAATVSSTSSSYVGIVGISITRTG
ncbi:MAG: hypothetical protein ABSA79_11580 [Candidatus Bathyarchaeia archaeon]